MRLVVSWLVNAAALWVATRIVPGIFVEGGGTRRLGDLVSGLVNAVVTPVLVLLTRPMTFVALGLFYLGLNGLMLYLAAALTPGFELGGFFSALLGAVVISVVGMILHGLLPG
jgi:putative membrane protein